MAPRWPTRFCSRAADHLDHRAAAGDQLVDVAVVVEDVEQALDVVGGDLALPEQVAASALVAVRLPVPSSSSVSSSSVSSSSVSSRHRERCGLLVQGLLGAGDAGVGHGLISVLARPDRRVRWFPGAGGRSPVPTGTSVRAVSPVAARCAVGSDPAPASGGCTRGTGRHRSPAAAREVSPAAWRARLFFGLHRLGARLRRRRPCGAAALTGAGGAGLPGRTGRRPWPAAPGSAGAWAWPFLAVTGGGNLRSTHYCWPREKRLLVTQ